MSAKRVRVTAAQVTRYNLQWGERIRSIREDLDLSREEVARRIGACPGSVKNWELGRVRPKTKKLLALAKLYGVEPYDFYRGIPRR